MDDFPLSYFCAVNVCAKRVDMAVHIFDTRIPDNRQVDSDLGAQALALRLKAIWFGSESLVPKLKGGLQSVNPRQNPVFQGVG
jgi:hypothetical protein